MATEPLTVTYGYIIDPVSIMQEIHTCQNSLHTATSICEFHYILLISQNIKNSYLIT